MTSSDTGNIGNMSDTERKDKISERVEIEFEDDHGDRMLCSFLSSELLKGHRVRPCATIYAMAMDEFAATGNEEVTVLKPIRFSRLGPPHFRSLMTLTRGAIGALLRKACPNIKITHIDENDAGSSSSTDCSSSDGEREIDIKKYRGNTSAISDYLSKASRHISHTRYTPEESRHSTGDDSHCAD